MYIFEGIISSIFPPKCIFCGNILDIAGSKPDICDRCFGEIPFTGDSFNSQNIKSFSGSYFDEIVCVCEYSGLVKRSLVKYKFFNKPLYYRTFAKLLSDKIRKMTCRGGFDVIIGVPLHKEREKARGYNQSVLISKVLSKELGIPEKSYLLSRIKNTGTQSLLSREERYLNVKDAFKVNNDGEIKNKSVLLIDDILTTGCTLDECCKVLKEAGAKRVVAAVIASGRKY